ncbi:hypothetical protein, variant [Verruconis gallopava]|uniref:GATA-type domain-containing protein n=1 Tax=Verruconis gallopava TaxID=253628 RepID=A0A0D1XBH6_9PEZI|nr:hypothetical protein, variant [Verruconis gallopava]KIV99540.1 hypothetical protein, variant [Verruconis gallopava]
MAKTQIIKGEFIENESPTQTRELAHSIERKETGTFQQTPLPLPQFEVPQLGLGEKLETAMQAMTTAMGAAIQTQLMAFMNIMLATRQNSTDSPSISTPESPVLSSTVRSTPTCLPQQHKEIQSRTPLHMLQSTSATRTMNSQDRPVVSPQISSGRVREVTSRGDVIREQTPGFGSLWSVPVKRKPGRPKQQSSSKSCPRTSGIAVAPKRLEKQECVSPRLAVSEKKRYPRDERPSAEFDSQGFTSSPTLGRHEREITISTPRDNTCEPNYSHKSFNKTTSGVPRMTYEAVKTHKVKDKTSQNYHQKSMSFVVDSDEDEIGMTTGSSSARQRGDSSSSQTPKVTDQDATTIAYEQHSQEYSSLSRAGLRNRDNNINYNEKAVFSDIFGNVGLDDNNYSTTSNQLRHYGKQPKLSQASDPENEFQGNDINQDMTSGLWQMDPNALKGPLVIYDVPTSHEPSKQAANVAVSRSHPKHHAGDAVSNTARTSATVTNYEELEARYAAFTTRNKREEIKYEERPPPHPCAHCKTTAATSWLHNPDGGLRRICNACFSYWKKHGGQKRPVSLEEPRSLKGKLPCANCGQIAASDWKFEIDGKRICKPCGRYAKLHNGARRPVPHPKMYECERCHNQVIKVWMLSNRAKICIDCHNEIFADYEPD